MVQSSEGGRFRDSVFPFSSPRAAHVHVGGQRRLSAPAQCLGTPILNGNIWPCQPRLRGVSKCGRRAGSGEGEDGLSYGTLRLSPAA